MKIDRMQIKGLFLAMLLLITSVASAQSEWDSGRGLSLSQVSERWSLHMRQRTLSDRIELIGKDIHIALVPGLSFARMGNQNISLQEPVYYRNGELVIPDEIVRALPLLAQRKAPAPRVVVHKGKTVILDPGHGGRDPGAIGYGGIREKDVNLQIAYRIYQVLRARGVHVIFTRTRDTFPSLQQRADLANRTPNSIFVSIHANAVGNSQANGIETFVLSNRISDADRARKASSQYQLKSGNGDWLSDSGQTARMERISQVARDQSDDLAQFVHGQLVYASGQSNRGIQRKNLHVLRENFFSPAILVEVGFLTHPATARILRSTPHRNRMADGIAQGILQYLSQPQNQAYASTANTTTAMSIIRR